MSQSPNQAPAAVSAPQGFVNVLTRRRFMLLFFFLLFDLILYPYIDHPGFRYYAFRALGTVVILVSVYAISYRRSLLVFGLLLAMPAVLHRILFFQAGAGTFPILNTILSLAFNVFVVVIIFRHIFAQDRPSSETIFGAICIYLLFGFSFASLYEMVISLQPGALYLDPATNLHTIPDRFDCLYYSFGAMTALGTSGITPVSNQMRSLTVIEAILGILYLAVLISRLVAAYRISQNG
jgi:hypothetical protein